MIRWLAIGGPGTVSFFTFLLSGASPDGGGPCLCRMYAGHGFYKQQSASVAGTGRLWKSRRRRQLSRLVFTVCASYRRWDLVVTNEFAPRRPVADAHIMEDAVAGDALVLAGAACELKRAIDFWRLE